MMSNQQLVNAKPIDERKRIIGTKLNQIPDEIINNTLLNDKIKKTLPSNYNFEIHKTLWRIKCMECKRIALQFPEGLFVFAMAIADIMSAFGGVDVVIMGDVTYGACCVDDFTASAIKCDMIVHYAHSCLVPLNQMIDNIKVLYIFVDIKIDLWHLVHTICANFEANAHHIAIAGTIQFVSSIHSVATELKKKHGYNVHVPQSKPLSPGEVLGCTAAKLPNYVNTIVFVSDGRFHLEAIMIANPSLNAFRYNPYDKEITREEYDFKKMVSFRENAIQHSAKVCVNSGCFGLILGTLGRQGNPKVLRSLQNTLNKRTKCLRVNLLMPEINPQILNLFKEVDAWVQIACPRLSIDWGNNFVSKPLLTPYEMNVAVDRHYNLIKTFTDINHTYPMDFYATNSYGNWTPSHKCHNDCVCEKV